MLFEKTPDTSCQVKEGWNFARAPPSKEGIGEVVPRPLDSVVTQNEMKFFPKDSLRFPSIWNTLLDYIKKGIFCFIPDTFANTE